MYVKIDDALKTHNLLVPYSDLDNEHKDMNHAAAEASFKPSESLGMSSSESRPSTTKIVEQSSSPPKPSGRYIGGWCLRRAYENRDRASTVKINRKTYTGYLRCLTKKRMGAHNAHILPALST